MHSCVLLFSGGRDSTLAAAWLGRHVRNITLLTVVADHLVGIDAVRDRVREMRRQLPPTTRWIVVSRPPVRFEEFGAARTCLPCQAGYLGVGLRYALAHQIPLLATGYTNYQSHYIEQSPEALAMLDRIKEATGIRVLTPVLHVSSKAEARERLRSIGLSDEAMEQKCLRVAANLHTSDADLRRSTAEAWITATLNDARRGWSPEITVLEELVIRPAGWSEA